MDTQNFYVPKKSGKYNFGRMNIGDHFIAGDYTESLQSSVLNAASRWARRNNCSYRFMTRKIKNKLMVWRIE